MTIALRNFRVEIQFSAQKPLRTRFFFFADQARAEAHHAYTVGVLVARVIRCSDGVVLFDPHEGIDVPVAEYDTHRSPGDLP